MPRPTLPLGTYGDIRVYRTANGFRVRTLYRDFDGRTRAVERIGKTKAGTTRALVEALRDRARTDARSTITPDTRVRDVAALWFATLEEEGRSPSTIQLYRDRLQRQVLPALGSVRVRELTVGLIDRHLAAVKAQHGNAIAKTTVPSSPASARSPPAMTHCRRIPAGRRTGSAAQRRTRPARYRWPRSSSCAPI